VVDDSPIANQSVDDPVWHERIYQNTQHIGPIAASGGRQILALCSGPTRTKCGRQKILVHVGRAIELPAVAPFDFLDFSSVAHSVA
jgi:hypothetical protein